MYSEYCLTGTASVDLLSFKLGLRKNGSIVYHSSLYQRLSGKSNQCLFIIHLNKKTKEKKMKKNPLPVNFYLLFSPQHPSLLRSAEALLLQLQRFSTKFAFWIKRLLFIGRSSYSLHWIPHRFPVCCRKGKSRWLYQCLICQQTGRSCIWTVVGQRWTEGAGCTLRWGRSAPQRGRWGVSVRKA